MEQAKVPEPELHSLAGQNGSCDAGQKGSCDAGQNGSCDAGQNGSCDAGQKGSCVAGQNESCDAEMSPYICRNTTRPSSSSNNLPPHYDVVIHVHVIL